MAKTNANALIDADDLAKLSAMTRLVISPAATPAALQALNNILAMMEKLQQADVTGVEDMAHVQLRGQTLRLRDDVIQPGYAPATLMNSAPQTAGHVFVVPKVIE